MIYTNVAFFLTPKSEVSFLYSDCTVRQGLEKLKRCGYTAIPVIDKSGVYVGMIREGDFLKYFTDGGSLRDTEGVKLTDILRADSTPPEYITVSMEKIIERAINNNFVPIVDDSGIFIGIITRGKVMKYLTNEIARNAFSSIE